MTKEEVLQKVNDLCAEKQYTNATLTDAFREKFANHFIVGNEEASIDDENISKQLEFAIRTAFASASDLASVKKTEWDAKEATYKNQIQELQKKVKNPQQVQQQNLELPEDVQNQLKELQAFKDERTKQERLANILSLAKEGIRKDLHGSFERFASKYSVRIDQEDTAQANSLISEFQEIFKDTIPDIRPKKPVQTQKEDSEFIANLPKIKV